MPAETAPSTSDFEVMLDIIQQAREAIWCIRFDRPVDITSGDDATVDQIFGNPAVWSMCNAAMARAYELPSEADLNGRDVRFHWPRNAVNEAFIRAVIASGYHIGGAISEDFRREGTPVLMENDVRAHVAGGQLYRLWGTLRELRHRLVQPTRDTVQSAALGFDLLPWPSCLINSDGAVLTDNAAWRQAFGTAGAEAARMIFRSAASVNSVGEFVLSFPLDLHPQPAQGGRLLTSALGHPSAGHLPSERMGICQSIHANPHRR
jgi:hypothetical protein